MCPVTEQTYFFPQQCEIRLHETLHLVQVFVSQHLVFSLIKHSQLQSIYHSYLMQRVILYAFDFMLVPQLFRLLWHPSLI